MIVGSSLIIDQNCFQINIFNAKYDSQFNFGNKFTKTRYKYLKQDMDIVGVMVETQILNVLVNNQQLNNNELYLLLWYTNF